VTPEEKMEAIAKAVATAYEFPDFRLLQTKALWQPLALARMIVMSIARSNGLLDRQIEAFLNRKHGVVTFAWRSVANAVATDAKVKARYELCLKYAKQNLEK
jgi:chromosomal replication initiation ATPase DnaA